MNPTNVDRLKNKFNKKNGIIGSRIVRQFLLYCFILSDCFADNASFIFLGQEKFKKFICVLCSHISFVNLILFNEEMCVEQNVRCVRSREGKTAITRENRLVTWAESRGKIAKDRWVPMYDYISRISGSWLTFKSIFFIFY